MDKGIIFSLGTAVAWALAVVLMRRAGDSVRPLPLNVIRYSLAITGFAFTLPFFPDETFPHLGTGDWIRVLVSGVLGGSLGDFFYLKGLNRLGAGTMAILDLAYLPLMGLLAWVIWGDTMSPQAIAGACLVAAGVAIATLGRKRLATKAPSAGGILYAFLALGSVMACALMIGDLIRSHSILWISLIRYVAATLVLMAVIWGRGLGPELQSALRSRGRRHAIFWSAVFGAYGASLLWFLGFKHTQMGLAAALNQTSSLFILLLARVYLHEPMTRRKWLAVGVGFLGAALVATS